MSQATHPLPSLELRGPEVTLRPLSADDAAALAEAASCAEEHYGFIGGFDRRAVS